jgi:hypothetical protein
MPGRSDLSKLLRQDGTLGPASVSDAIQRIADDRYESDWTRIDAAATGTFWHERGQIPATVDVLRATSGDGAGAESVLTSLTITKTGDKVTILNGTSTNYFFKVRAQ